MNEKRINESYCWYSIGLYPRWNIFVEKTLQNGRHPALERVDDTLLICYVATIFQSG